MSSSESEHVAHEHDSGSDEPRLPVLEDDQNVAPRPEEEIADRLRAEPDAEGRAGRPH